MKIRLTLLAVAALSLSAAGCNSADNANANTNANRAANANANANVVAANTNTANANAGAGAYNRNYNTREDYGRDETSYRDEAKRSGETVGSGLEDGWLHFKVRAALAAVDGLRDSTINVDVDNNVVTLRGSVAGAASKARARDAARAVEGVRSVTDRLEVKAGDANAGAADANRK